MARRTIDVKIQEKGRDQGKLFKITEMSAFDTEQWVTRSINAILRHAHSDEVALLLPLVYSYTQQLNEEKTMEAVLEDAKIGKTTILNAAESLAIYMSSMFFRLPFEELQKVTKPLLDCASIYLDPNQSELTESILNNPNQYIEEPLTIYTLEREAFKLHSDFFSTGVMLHLKQFLKEENLVNNPIFTTPPTSL